MGIIDQADGGMLFLDEIHRLPPEGQEMIFYFMDHGTYSRLGETTKSHEANVRIVGATTEDPGLRYWKLLFGVSQLISNFRLLKNVLQMRKSI